MTAANTSHESAYHDADSPHETRALPPSQNLLEKPRQWVVDQTDHLEGAVRQAVRKLHAEGDHTLAAYVEVVADQIGGIKQYVAQRDPRELLNQAKTAVKRRPELLVAGILLGSVGLAVFFKSRQQASGQGWEVPDMPPPPDVGYDEAPASRTESSSLPPPGGVSGAYEPQPGSPYADTINQGGSPEIRP